MRYWESKEYTGYKIKKSREGGTKFPAKAGPR